MPRKIKNVKPSINHLSTIQQRMIKARINAGYRSQDTFAKALGVSRGLVGQWESGVKPPGRDNLLKAAELCGVTPQYLAGTSDDNRQQLVLTNSNEIGWVYALRQLTLKEQERLLEALMVGLRARRVEKRQKQSS
jgi:transcriptional regulator with XRE-family HTH domain